MKNKKKWIALFSSLLVFTIFFNMFFVEGASHALSTFSYNLNYVNSPSKAANISPSENILLNTAARNESLSFSKESSKSSSVENSNSTFGEKNSSSEEPMADDDISSDSVSAPKNSSEQNNTISTKDNFPVEEYAGVEIEQQSIIQEDGSIIVYTFQELKTVLTSPQQYPVVYIGDDMQFEAGGIAIHSSWTQLILDGTNPLTGERHTVTEYRSLSTNDTIRSTNANLSDITIRNIDISGKNYYGFVYIPLYQGVTITYDNINYIGPQLTYNRYGTARYIDSNITLDQNGSASYAAELAEISFVEFGGDTTIISNTTSSSVIWIPTTSGSITVLEGSNVKIQTSYYFTYPQNYVTPLLIEDNASFEYIGESGMTYGTTYFSEVTVGTNSTFKATKKDTSGYAVLRVGSNLTIAENATFLLTQTNANAPALYMCVASANITLDSPNKVMLLSPTGYAMRFTGAGTLTATTQTINLWSTLPNGVVDTVTDTPTHIWNQQDGSSFTTTATFSNLTTSTVTSSWQGTSTQWNGLLAKDTFNACNAKNIIFGKYILDVDAPIDIDTVTVNGVTNSNAEIAIYYGEEQKLANANADGSFTIPVDFSEYILGIQVSVLSNHNQIKSYRIFTLEDISTLEFLFVPSEIPFQTTTIPARPTYISRNEPNITFSIQDTRGAGSTWRLDARSTSPFTSSDGNTLDGNFIYFTEDGNTVTLNETDSTVYNGTTQSDSITSLEWEPDIGLFFHLQTISTAKPNILYSSTIEWTLVDAP